MCCILLLTKPWQVKLETSPLLVLLQVGGDPNTIPKKGCYTCLGLVAAQHSMKTSFNENQVTISKQLIEVGCADVNLACSKEQVGAIPPLYFACWSTHCTNLDFIQLLLEHGANPNQQMVDLRTPLMNTLAMSLSAALFILKFEHDNAVNVDVHIRDRYGESVLDMVKVILTQFVRQRDTVFRTGKADPISDTGWTTTAPYDTHIEQLIELTYLFEARGAKMSPKPGVPISMKKLCGITTWSGHLALTCNWQQNQCTNIDSINFDISSLFNMDIMTDSNAPSWCKDKNGKCIFFISDKKTIQFQNHEGKDHLHSAGGCTPAVGQKLQIQCNLPGNLQGCRLSGKVVEVFPAPSDTDLKRSKRSSNPSSLYQNPCHCSDPKCSQTKTGKRFDILRKFGCLHGQEVKGTVRLAKELRSSEMIDFFGNKKYDVVLRCDDRQENMWIMVRINPHESSK